MDQELADAAAYGPDRRYVCTNQVAAYEMMSWIPSWKCDVKSKIRLRQSMRIWRTILPNFIPIRFETTEPWTFLKDEEQEEEQQQADYET